MYAIVRQGGRQHKVAVGDVLEVDKVSDLVGSELSLTALLLVDGADVDVVVEIECARVLRRSALRRVKLIAG